MIREDDRTEEQRKATVALVVMTDKFLSGWGKAPGKSYAAWPVYDAGKLNDSELAVAGRSDALRVRVVREPYRPHLGAGDHLHIYANSPVGRWN